MGTYLNPGNKGFSDILGDKYVDKTGLISLINNVIDTPRKLNCMSRPRRFGKSFTVKTLCAYYDCSCDSRELFRSLAISEDKDYEKHLNKYDVIYLDMSDLKPYTDDYKQIVPFLNRELNDEVCRVYPEIRRTDRLPDTLVNAAQYTGKRFVMLIDEWDAPIRENIGIQEDYLDFLRSLFKSSRTTDRSFATVYMTGILPIKKDGSQSALSDFNEWTMLDPGPFSIYFGFTPDEVKTLCNDAGMDFKSIEQWYDGYKFDGGVSIYNPNSVIKAVNSGKLRSYWVQSSALDNLISFISMDFDGLSKTIAELIGGAEVSVNVNMFDNDLVSFRNKDSVLTLLIHLGYLTYNEQTGKAHIPNEEILIEFSDKIREVKQDETIRRVAESNKLIMDTVQMNEEAVAAQIEKVHDDETAALFYNNEQALRGIIKLAYFAYKDYYIKFEELPAGVGFADIVYFPKTDTSLPALLIELKWDKSAKGAIDQIKDKKYPETIRSYGGEVLLVGINYDKAASPEKRKHSCVIERME